LLSHPQPVLALAAIVLTLCAAYTDQKTGLIPNRMLTIGLAVIVMLRLGLALASGKLGTALALLGLGALTCGLIPLALYIAGALGGGDVKLMTVCGAALGPVLGLQAELYSFGFGALYALGAAAYSGELLQTLLGSALLLTNPLIPRRLRKPVPEPARRTIRFAPAICAGVLVAVTAGWSSAP
jgi:prepilin peptidase CpaA